MSEWKYNKPKTFRYRKGRLGYGIEIEYGDFSEK